MQPFYTHGHLRADAITRSGIVEPYYVRQISPVEVARHIIDPFIWSVRETGFEALTPWEMNAACDCAAHLMTGEPVKVSNQGQTVTVAPGEPAPAGPAGKIVQKAYDALRALFQAQSQPTAASSASTAAPTPSEAGTRQVYIPPPS